VKLTAPPEDTSSARLSLYQQVKWARFWLPLAIVGVVLVHQLVILPLGDEAWRFWGQLLFYSILGPAVTFVTLDWIAQQLREREEAQGELRRLYLELQASHELLTAIQKVTEQFAAAPDLEAALSAASRGIREVAGATGIGIFFRGGDVELTRGDGLSQEALADAKARHQRLAAGEEVSEVGAGGTHVLFMPLRWAGRFEGSVHAYYPSPPSAEQRESFRILASEFSAAAEAARGRTKDLLTLFEVDRSIRAEGNLEKLLSTLLSQMMARSEAGLGAVFLVDEDGSLQLRVHHGFASPPPLAPVRFGEGFVGEVALQGEPRVLDETQQQAYAKGLLARAESAVGLPLASSEGLLGVVVLADPRPRHFSAAQLPFLSLLANQVSLAVKNARAYLQSEELAIAEERARIAREIHDGIAQSLAFSALKLDLVARLMEQHPEKAKEELKVVKQTVRELIREARRSIFALRPIDLERHGFVETIRRYATDYAQQNDIRVSLSVGELPQLTLKSEATLFRIFQEAMHNVAKHARASQVQVTLGVEEGGSVFVEVEDDGCGFDPESVPDRVTSAGGLGLKQMRERMLERGGTFRLTSRPGEGTSVYAALPE
jgi:signal transduction histidine kinase